MIAALSVSLPAPPVLSTLLLLRWLRLQFQHFDAEAGFCLSSSRELLICLLVCKPFEQSLLLLFAHLLEIECVHIRLSLNASAL